MSGLVVTAISCFFEVTIFWTFFSGVLRKRYANKRINVFLYACIFALMLSINLLHNTVINLVANIIIYFLFYNMIFDGEIKEKIFFFMVFYTVFAGIEIVIEFLLMSFMGSNYSWNSESLIFRMIVFCLEKLITFLVLFGIKKKVEDNKNGMGTKAFLCSLVLPIGTFFLYVELLYSKIIQSSREEDNLLLAFACVFLLFANVLIFMIYDRFFSLNNEKQQLEISSLKMQMEKRNYDSLEKINFEHKCFVHDLNNYLKTIDILAKDNNTPEINTIIENMQGEIEALAKQTYCNHTILNALLLQKKEEAEINDIDYVVSIEPGVEFSSIDDVDIICMLGNLLDNAIEANREIRNGAIEVSAFSTQYGHFLVIRVQNTWDGKNIGNTRSLLTKKKDKKNHGLGLGNVKRCVEKYGGIFETECDGKFFCSTLIFTII